MAEKQIPWEEQFPTQVSVAQTGPDRFRATTESAGARYILDIVSDNPAKVEEHALKSPFGHWQKEG